LVERENANVAVEETDATGCVADVRNGVGVENVETGRNKNVRNAKKRRARRVRSSAALLKVRSFKLVR
jgi:hypothetical protein